MAPYSPEPLPIAAINYGDFVEVMGEANRELVRYDGLLQGIPNPNVLLSVWRQLSWPAMLIVAEHPAIIRQRFVSPGKLSSARLRLYTSIFQA